MRVIVAVKGQPGGSATSRITRYIAERDRHEEREGKEPRALFSEGEDRLSYRKADQTLTGAWTPHKDELLHLAVSFHETDFNALGEDEDRRQQQLKTIARGAMAEMTEALGAQRLIWVAGIHRNTVHPHLHLVIHRDYLDGKSHRAQRLDRLPKEFLPSKEKDGDGQAQIRPGRISQSFADALDRAIERAQRSVLTQQENKRVQRLQGNDEARRDRTLLGRAMIAADRVEQLLQQRDGHRQHGELRRYEITNEQGRRCVLSLADVRHQAEARADQSLRRSQQVKGQARLNGEERSQARQILLTRDLAGQANVIERIEQARATALTRTEMRLGEAEKAAAPLVAAAAEIKDKYQTAGNDLPTPLLSRAHLSRMQERAISAGDAGRVKELETIRHALAAEHNALPRTSQEMGRLAARRLLAQSELALAQERTARFDETKHQWRWPVRDGEARRSSLAEVERAIAWETDQARFIGRTRIHWDAGRRERAGQRALELSAYRQSICAQIEAQRERLNARVEEKAKMAETLSGIERAEQETYRSQGEAIPPPLPNQYEIGLLDGHAQRLRDPALHELVARLERDAGISLEERAGHAGARTILADAEAHSARLRVERFAAQRREFDVIVKDEGPHALTIKRLSDSEPKSEREKLFFLFRQAEFRAVATAVDQHGRQLAADFERAEQCRAVLNELAQQTAREFRREHPDRELPAPKFTPGELAALELSAARDSDRGGGHGQLYGEARGREHVATVAEAELSRASVESAHDDPFSR